MIFVHTFDYLNQYIVFLYLIFFYY